MEFYSAFKGLIFSLEINCGIGEPIRPENISLLKTVIANCEATSVVISCFDG